MLHKLVWIEFQTRFKPSRFILRFITLMCVCVLLIVL